MTPDDQGVQRKRRRLDQPDARPYVLKPLLRNIKLAGDDVEEEVHINCVEYWNDNLYIGTSASEILHFVSLPFEPSDDASEPTFIEASRLQPAGYENEGTELHVRGVKSIIILPAASRACVLCNGTVSFYTLPELSPAPNGREVQGCQWLSGPDINEVEAGHDFQDLMVASAKRIRVVRVGEKIQALKSIQFPGCIKSVRRGTIACVSDGMKYALLEVEHQQKIPLFPISSLGDSDGTSLGQVEDLPTHDISLPSRISSLPPNSLAAGVTSGHSRGSSLSNLVSGLGRRQLSPRPNSSVRERLASPSSQNRSPSPTRPSTEAEHAITTLSPQPVQAQTPSSPRVIPATPSGEEQNHAPLLKPHILSLVPGEFLLTTGTTENEPGVGMFVNLEGDMVRGTIQFECYPESMVVDPSLQDSGSVSTLERGRGSGSLCVMMRRNESSDSRKAVQIFPIKSNLDEMTTSSEWIELPAESVHVDFQATSSTTIHRFRQVASLLKLVRVHLPEAEEPEVGSELKSIPTDKSTPEWELTRNKEEAAFAQSFGRVESQVILWSDNNLLCLSANPWILQMEAQLNSTNDQECDSLVSEIFESLRNRDAQTETDFLSFNYIRQKGSLLMFKKLAVDNPADSTALAMRATENMLIESNLDPRVVMLLLPMLETEVLRGPQGIWLSAGLTSLVEDAILARTALENVPVELWQMVRRYMAIWQGKRGFGSVTDDQYVFDSVDSALLRLLLHLEQTLARGSPAASSIRSKLYNVVDNWKGDFNRAVALLEEYRRLFPLSRLYQSRRLARDVLSTWKRVINGEVDGVGELNPDSAEMQMRRYLVNIRDTALVEEYALWLAQKNAHLAVEVFTDDKSRVGFSPPHVLQLLKRDAPGAVQIYLEYLVFNKGSTKYADDLIGYYLDSVLSVLESSETARDSLTQSYSTYRALEAPKPTYLSFIHENAPSEPWWQSRLRLLQLLGGGKYASTSPSASSELTYSIPTVLARLAPFSRYLVSESIILDARQGRHRQALSLLTHGLGDYDTAVRYCYFAGPQSATSVPLDESQLPTFDVQKDLFNALLEEFLSIEELSIRLERSSELLAKFAKWFDPVVVLGKIPADWSLGIISEFLLRTMRALRGEMMEVSVVKALSAGENLRKHAELVEVCEKMGARIEAEKALRNEENGEVVGRRSEGLGL